MLKFENVTKSFVGPEGKVHAANNISFSIKQGELVVVQGPSGSGKTTLLLMAGGLLQPDSGQVIIAGEDPYKLDHNQCSKLRAEKIGFVFQQFYLIPYLTIKDNILSAAGPRIHPDSYDRANDLIKQFKLEHRSKHVPSQLSTGERQRTALARALLNKPKIILADEPTGNLDEKNADIVLSYLAQFVKDGGAVLLVSHDKRTEQYADRTFRVEDGKISG